MKKNLDQWERIADLIALDRKMALDEFRRHEFVPGHFPERQVRSLSGWKRGTRPVIIATAASLLLVIGLFSFRLFRGNGRGQRPAAQASVLLSGSFLYGLAGSLEVERPGTGTEHPFSPYFSACAAAALHWSVAAVEPVVPSAAVERGDPEAVRRKMGRVIRENTLEQLLMQFREMQNKEA
jgi:hypothetical protein